VAPVQLLLIALINWFLVPGLSALQQMGQEWCLVRPPYEPHLVSLLTPTTSVQLPLTTSVQLPLTVRILPLEALTAPKALTHTSPDLRLLDQYRLSVVSLFPLLSIAQRLLMAPKAP